MDQLKVALESAGFKRENVSPEKQESSSPKKAVKLRRMAEAALFDYLAWILAMKPDIGEMDEKAEAALEEFVESEIDDTIDRLRELARQGIELP